jgi:hypothetical protein
VAAQEEVRAKARRTASIAFPATFAVVVLICISVGLVTRSVLAALVIAIVCGALILLGAVVIAFVENRRRA